MLCNLSLATTTKPTNIEEIALNVPWYIRVFYEIMTSHASLTLNLACVPLNFLFPFLLSLSRNFLPALSVIPAFCVVLVCCVYILIHFVCNFFLQKNLL